MIDLIALALVALLVAAWNTDATIRNNAATVANNAATVANTAALAANTAATAEPTYADRALDPFVQAVKR